MNEKVADYDTLVHFKVYLLGLYTLITVFLPFFFFKEKKFSFGIVISCLTVFYSVMSSVWNLFLINNKRNCKKAKLHWKTDKLEISIVLLKEKKKEKPCSRHEELIQKNESPKLVNLKLILLKLNLVSLER